MTFKRIFQILYDPDPNFGRFCSVYFFSLVFFMQAIDTAVSGRVVCICQFDIARKNKSHAVTSYAAVAERQSDCKNK